MNHELHPPSSSSSAFKVVTLPSNSIPPGRFIPTKSPTFTTAPPIFSFSLTHNLHLLAPSNISAQHVPPYMESSNNTHPTTLPPLVDVQDAYLPFMAPSLPLQPRTQAALSPGSSALRTSYSVSERSPALGSMPHRALSGSELDNTTPRSVLPSNSATQRAPYDRLPSTNASVPASSPTSALSSTQPIARPLQQQDSIPRPSARLRTDSAESRAESIAADTVADGDTVSESDVALGGGSRLRQGEHSRGRDKLAGGADTGRKESGKARKDKEAGTEKHAQGTLRDKRHTSPSKAPVRGRAADRGDVDAIAAGKGPGSPRKPAIPVNHQSSAKNSVGSKSSISNMDSGKSRFENLTMSPTKSSKTTTASTGEKLTKAKKPEPTRKPEIPGKNLDSSKTNSQAKIPQPPRTQPPAAVHTRRVHLTGDTNAASTHLASTVTATAPAPAPTGATASIQPPGSVAPGSVAPGSVAPGSVAPGSVAPGSVATAMPTSSGSTTAAPSAATHAEDGKRVSISTEASPAAAASTPTAATSTPAAAASSPTSSITLSAAPATQSTPQAIHATATAGLVPMAATTQSSGPATMRFFQIPLSRKVSLGNQENPEKKETPPSNEKKENIPSTDFDFDSETWDTVIPTHAPVQQCTCHAVLPSVLSLQDKATYFAARTSEGWRDVAAKGGNRTFDDDVGDDDVLHMKITKRPSRLVQDIAQKNEDAPVSNRLSDNFSVDVGRKGRMSCPIHGSSLTGRSDSLSGINDNNPVISVAPKPLPSPLISPSSPVTLRDDTTETQKERYSSSPSSPTAPPAINRADVDASASASPSPTVAPAVSYFANPQSPESPRTITAGSVLHLAVLPAADVIERDTAVERAEEGGDEGAEAVDGDGDADVEIEIETGVEDVEDGLLASVDALSDAGTVASPKKTKKGKKTKKKDKKGAASTVSSPVPAAADKEAKSNEKDRGKGKETEKGRKKTETNDRPKDSRKIEDGKKKSEDKAKDAQESTPSNPDALSMAALARVQAHRKQLQNEKQRQEEQEWLRRNQRQLKQREEDALQAWERAKLYMINRAYKMLVEHQFEEFVEAKRRGKDNERAVINFS